MTFLLLRHTLYYVNWCILESKQVINVSQREKWLQNRIFLRENCKNERLFERGNVPIRQAASVPIRRMIFRKTERANVPAIFLKAANVVVR